jgi:hypothetical protein
MAHLPSALHGNENTGVVMAYIVQTVADIGSASASYDTAEGAVTAARLKLTAMPKAEVIILAPDGRIYRSHQFQTLISA